MKSLPIVLAAAVISTAAIAEAPSMTIGWLDIKLSFEDCTATGGKSMRDAGLTTNFEVLDDTVYGETGDYTAAIRCLISNSVAVFVTAGPDSKRTEEITAKLKAPFNTP
jgi:hypothetical protein